MKVKNELQNYEDEFLNQIREKEAWKNISKNVELPWDIDFIEKYSDKLDWGSLCKNAGIPWDVELIDKFKYLINWNVLSKNILNYNMFYPRKIDWDIFKKFDRYWNWNELSTEAGYIPIDVLEQYADNWDWKELINNQEINWTFVHFEKFKNYIPITDFEILKRSELWEKLIKIDEQIITGKIING